jgi:hypothetical protein
MKYRLLLVAILISVASWGQTNLAAGGTFTENFNGLGTSSIASLPTNWKAQKTTTVRDVALTYSTGLTAVELAGGNSMSTTATNGIYRYNASNVTTESALGGLSSGTNSKTVAFMSYFNNNTATAIGSFTISYDVEKYRNGSNAAGFTIDLLYSTDGTTWTSCGGTLITSFAADADNNGYATAPATTTAVTGAYTPAASISLNEKFYFAWRYSVTSGTTTSNAQALGFDNVTITASSSTPPAVTIADNGTQITVANVAQGTANHILSTFQTTVANSSATLTTASFATSGAYQVADIVASGLKLWYNTTNDFSTATQVGSGFTATATGTGETITFSSLSQSVSVGTRYFWVTASITASATTGRTISLNTIGTGNLTFSSGTKSGSATAGGTQTITITPPAVPGSLTRVCTSNSMQSLTWTAPATGTFDGYMLVVREAATPHAVTSLVASSQTFNSNYTLAPTYGSTAILSRVLYIGTGTSATITGLTQGVNYTFAVYAYKNDGASTLYSTTATTTTPTINLPNVTSASTTAGNTSGSLTWVNPNATCYDQVLVVVTATPGITFIPTGSTNTAYTPNSAFTGFNQAVYYSSGNLVNITGLTNGTTYYLEIFVRTGSEWSSGVEVNVTPLNINPTVLKTGDLVLIAFDNNVSSGDDGIRLLTMVDINPGTRFLWVNATYETGGLPTSNVRTNKWYSCTTTPDGNVPFLEFNYIGSAVIPEGSVFCITTLLATTASTITAISPTGISFPNTNFTITGKKADGTLLSSSHSDVNVSTSSPDSMFLMQGNFSYNSTGSTFIGTVLSSVQDGGTWYDLADDLSGLTGNNLRRSRKHPNLLCASLQANTTTASYEVSYDVSVTPGNTTGTKSYLLGQILNYTTNWITSYGVCPASSPFIISASDTFNRWTGGVSNNWFDCNNWAQLMVPDEFTDVVVFALPALNNAVIDFSAPFSDSFSDTAKTRNLTISGRRVQLEANVNNKLEVHGNLLINTTGVLDMDDGTAAADGIIKLKGNWTNNVGDTAFSEGNGTVEFVGTTPQLISSVGIEGTEIFYNVVLDNNFDTAVSNDLIASGDLTIKTGKNVNIDSDGYIEAYKKLDQMGNLTIENNGQLIQVDEIINPANVYTGNNTGNIIYKRIATGIRGFDYVYWSSPVTGQNISSLYSITTPGLKYFWNPLASNVNTAATTTTGNWQPASGLMTPATGYIIRGSASFGMPETNIPATFTGVPNNGIITATISRGSNQIPSQLGVNGATVTNLDDNWNLVGNPYPSSIKATEFLKLSNNPNIQGFIKIWTHGTAPVSTTNPFYGSFAYNYTANDYITYNAAGASSGPSVFNGNIASGQGFFVAMNDGLASSSTVTFNNSMRSKTYLNNQFFRSSTIAQETGEANRIWLDLVDSNNNSLRTLLGYFPEATEGFDRMYDAQSNINNASNIYSIVEDKTVIIQGRPTPFNENDQVPIGVRIMTAGNYKIAIGTVDGLFEQGQPIFLEDKVLNIIHDLRLAPYSFTSVTGRFDNRFVLRYTNSSALDNPDFETLKNSVILASNHGELTIKSTIENIQDVTVYDILGRQLFETKGINNNEFVTSNISMNQQTLIIKIKLVNGVIVTKKIIL